MTISGSAHRVSELWLAARVGAWLCWLPVRLRKTSLPALLACLTHPHDPAHEASLSVNTVVRVVRRVCGLRLFEAWIFPRGCLREALALYHVLTPMGYPVRFHIGVRKDGGKLVAHSWVTMAGEPVDRAVPLAAFSTVYSFPTKGNEQ